MQAMPDDAGSGALRLTENAAQHLDVNVCRADDHARAARLPKGLKALAT